MNRHDNQKTRKSGSLFLSKHNTHSHLTTIHISKQSLEHNLQHYKSIVGTSVRLAPVIKSNAYGHGIYQIAQICESNPNVEMLCVALLSEAIMLREYGITKPILVLNIIDADLEYIIDNTIEIALYDLRIAYELNSIARARKQKAYVHIKVDTGLSRLGILWDSIASFIQQLQKLTYIIIQGIFTHFAESENNDQTFTNVQIERFNTAIQTCELLGITIPLRHTSCSAAITANISSHYNLARVGLGIYGLWSSNDNFTITQTNYPQFSLQPVLTWQTTIIQIKTIPSGSFVGYDRTFQAQHDMQIAILAAGYWDGVDRRLSNKGHVLVHNTLAPIIGRIAMNTMMIDITHIPQVQVGNHAVLLGNHKGITADNLAQHIGSIHYEVVTRINPLLPRYIT